MDPLDKLVDSLTDHQGLDEEFYEERLKRYDDDETRWATAIDTAAYDVVEDVAIGSTDSKSDIGGTIGKTDFPRAAGPFYIEGLKALTDAESQIETVLENYEDEDVGRLVLKLTELRLRLQSATSGELNAEILSKILEALVEKLTTKEVESGTLRRPLRETEAVVDMLVQLLTDPTADEYTDVLVDEMARAAENESILELVDEPQLTTPLWEHQADALRDWVDEDRRGYVNMATATGKTVLGLATIAQQFDGLHPANDAEGLTPESPFDLDGDLQVLIVAGRNLLLNQWRDEFAAHMNIPKHRTEATDTGDSQEIRLSWGTVEFKSSQQLASDDLVGRYDLIILDEAHRYSSGSSTDRGWRDTFETLAEKSEDILAMSGSIDAGWIGDETVESVLDDELDEVFTFSLPEARKKGIVADFSWKVTYVPTSKADAIEELIDVTETCAKYFGPPAGPNFESLDDIVAAADIGTIEELRAFANTSDGRELRNESEKFDTLANAAFSRLTRRWQLRPSLEPMVDIVRDHRDEQTVVLVQSYSFAERIESVLAEEFGRSTLAALTDRTDDTEEIIEEFNEGEASILVGPGDLLGTGVDLPDAEVAVNVGKGGLNASLVQRIGRVLRNPSGRKDASFYHLMSVPTDDRAILPTEDGRQFLERICSFELLGERMEEPPSFQHRGDGLEANLRAFEENGVLSFDLLPRDIEALADSAETADRLTELCQIVEQSDYEMASFTWAGTNSTSATSEDESENRARAEDEETPESEQNTDEMDEDQTESSDECDELPESVTRKQLDRVDDVVAREPIIDDELIELWGLDSSIALAKVLKGELDDYLTRDDEGAVCATELGRGLVDHEPLKRDTDDGQDRAEPDESEEESRGEDDNGGPTDDSDGGGGDTDSDDETDRKGVTPPYTGPHLEDEPEGLVEDVQIEFSVPETTAHRLLDLYRSDGPIGKDKLVEGWDFEAPSDIYEYLSDSAHGLTDVVGLGDVQLADDARDRMDTLTRDRDDQEGPSPEDSSTEDARDDSPSESAEDTETEDGRTDEEESERAVPDHYSSSLLETDREKLVDELQEMNDFALYPPTEETVVSKSRYPFGSYIFTFGSFDDALRTAGYKLRDQTLTDDTGEEYRPSEVIAAVQILSDILGEPPRASVFDQLAPMASDAVSSLGTWDQIVTEAGLESDELREEVDVTDVPDHDELSASVASLAEELGETPTLEKIAEHTDLDSGRVASTVESWRDVEERVKEKLSSDGRGVTPYPASVATRQFADQVRGETSSGVPLYRMLDLFPTLHILDVIDSSVEDVFPDLQAEGEPAEAEQTESEYTETDGEIGLDDVREAEGDESPVIVEERLQPERDLERRTLLGDDLRRLYDEFGHPPRPADISNYGRFSPSAYIDEFGSWEAALSNIGCDIDEAWGHPEDYDDELLATLADLTDRVGHTPTARNIDELSDHTATTFVSRFGSIEGAHRESDPEADNVKWAREIVETVSESWEPLGAFDDETERERAGVEALLLLKRGWTGTGHEVVSEVAKKIDADSPSYRNGWKKTIRPILQEAESRDLVEQAQETCEWTWVGGSEI